MQQVQFVIGVLTVRRLQEEEFKQKVEESSLSKLEKVGESRAASIIDMDSFLRCRCRVTSVSIIFVSHVLVVVSGRRAEKKGGARKSSACFTRKREGGTGA